MSLFVKPVSNLPDGVYVAERRTGILAPDGRAKFNCDKWLIWVQKGTIIGSCSPHDISHGCLPMEEREEWRNPVYWDVKGKAELQNAPVPRWIP